MTVLLAGIGLGSLVGLVSLFTKWEREGKSYRAPVGLLMMLVIEATLYANDNTIPRGLFHPGLGSLQLRLPEVYIALALLGRLVAHGKPARIGLSAALWAAFGAWLAVGAVEGHLYGNLLSQNLYEAKAIVYVVGGFALAAGVPIRRYLDTQAFTYLRNFCIVSAIILDLMTLGHKTLSIHLPLVPLSGFGSVGSTSAAFYIAIGTVYFLTELASGPPRVAGVLALIPALLAVILSHQRAVVVNLVVIVAVMVLVLIIGYGRSVARRLRVQMGHVLLVVLAACAVGTVAIVAPAALHDKPAQIPFSSEIGSTFHSGNQALAAQDRLNMASEVEHLIPQHLFIGWGLGVEFPYYEPGVRQVLITPYAHDIVLDLWLRTGLIGLLFFLGALIVSLFGGISVWRRHPDPVVAAWALALVAIIAGLFANALLEPLLDEYRLATLLGLSLGLLRSAVTSGDTMPVLQTNRRRLQVSSLMKQHRTDPSEIA